MDIKNLLENLKDFNIRSEMAEPQDDFIFEECDTIYDLLFELEINLYNNLLNTLEDLKTDKYLNEIKDIYLLDKKGNKLFITEFIPYIYQTEGRMEGEWRMKGDEKFGINYG